MAFDPITAGLDLAKTLIDAIVSRIPDPAERERERARLEAQAEAASQAQVIAQLEVNKAEASSGSLFVAGWRPGAGWLSVASIAYAGLVQPLLAWGSAIAHLPPPPAIDTEIFLYLLGGMLGLGGLRSFDKVRGVATAAVPLAPAGARQ